MPRQDTHLCGRGVALCAAAFAVACGSSRIPDGEGASPPPSSADAGIAPTAPPSDLLDQWHIRYLGVGDQPIPFEWPSAVGGKVAILDVPAGVFHVDGDILQPGAQVSAADLARAQYVEHARVPGSAGALHLSYLTPDRVPVEFAVSIDLEVHPCDELAASPLDPERYAEGTYLLDAQGAGQANVLDPEAALPQCEAALEAYPSVGRFMLQLARCHWRLGNYGVALDLSEQAMDVGLAWGLAAVGNHYRDGLGVGQDLEYAFGLLSTASEMGHPGAQHTLAQMLQEGEGVTSDESAAIVPLTQAAKYGFHWAQYHLGTVYSDGRGTEVDWERARHWFEKAATQNNGYALHNLGLIFLRGDGIEADAPRAEKYFLNAAALELPRALYQLGLLYRDGAAGVGVDLEKAVDYLTRALLGGVEAAQDALDAMVP